MRAYIASVGRISQAQYGGDNYFPSISHFHTPVLPVVGGGERNLPRQSVMSPAGREPPTAGRNDAEQQTRELGPTQGYRAPRVVTVGSSTN